MKSNTTFIFAGIMSAIISNAFATGENTVTSKSYVDTQDALKQDKIPAKSTADTLSSTSLVESTDESGIITERRIFDHLVDWDSETDGETSDFMNQIGSAWENADVDEIRQYVPTVGAVDDAISGAMQWMQELIPQSGYGATGQANVYGEFAANSANSWLYDRVKGSGLVTKTDADGIIGERKIFEATDVLGYHAQNLTQIQKDIQDISIPTVGAMMTAISNGVSAATPTGTPNTIANYGANGALDSGIAMYTGAAAYNSTNDSAKIPTMAGVATYAQAKMTCAGWPDGVEHTDANCWLWYKN